MIVSGYIRRQVTNVALVATIFLCAAIVLIQSIRFVDLIVNRGLSAVEFGFLASLMVPRFVAVIMPIALFGGTVFIYQRMIQDSEFVVLRSSGMSTFQLARPAIFLALGASVLCFSMTLYFMPLAAQELRAKIIEQRSKWGSALLQEGKFATFGKDVTIFVRERDGDVLNGILYHNAEDPDQSYTILARHGQIVEGENGPRIVVSDGSRQSFADGRLHVVRFDQTSLAIAFENAKEVHWPQPEERFLPRLLSPDQSAGDVRYRPNLIAEAHHRIVLPLLPITYTMIGLAFVLRVGYSRRGRGETIFAAFICVVAILMMHLWAKSASAKTPELIAVMYANAIVPALLALVFVVKPHTGGRSARRRSGPPTAPDSTPGAAAS